MTDLRKAAQMALDWRDKNSELLFELGGWDFIFEINDWSQSIRGALAQPEQEPTRSQKMRDAGITRRPKGWDKEQELEGINEVILNSIRDSSEVVAPPQREWQGLTDEEMLVAAFKAGFDVHEDYDNEDDPDALHWWSEDGEQCDDTLHKLRDIIEAKLREKNT